MVRMVCWNINRSPDAFTALSEMDDVDVALLQEVGKGAAGRIADTTGEGVPWNWNRSSIWPAVVRLSDRVRVDLFTPVPLEREGIPLNAISVSDSRMLAAARVTPLRGGKPALESFLVFSMHARWLYPHPQAERARPRGGQAVYAYSDGSAHRIISDVSAFITHTDPSSHRLLAAGDLGTIYGAADNGRMENPARAQTACCQQRTKCQGDEATELRWYRTPLPDSCRVREMDRPEVNAAADGRWRGWPPGSATRNGPWPRRGAGRGAVEALFQSVDLGGGKRLRGGR